jgi:acyl carrier protein
VLVNEIMDKVAELAKVPKSELSPKTELYNSTTISSLSLLALMTHIEKRYAITMAPEELFEENFRDIQSLAAFVERKRQAASPAIHG